MNIITIITSVIALVESAFIVYVLIEVQTAGYLTFYEPNPLIRGFEIAAFGVFGLFALGCIIRTIVLEEAKRGHHRVQE